MKRVAIERSEDAILRKTAEDPLDRRHLCAGGCISIVEKRSLCADKTA
jgi:hypothetical protein